VTHPHTSSAPPVPPERQILSDHTVLTLLTSASAHLRSLGFDESRLHVEWMLARVLGLKRLDLYLQFDRPLTRDEVDRFKALYRRRLDHEPLQYILGDTEFMGRRFLVDRRVLIPRPETELLVECAVRILRPGTGGSPGVLDIGTGSGNIALSVAALVPGARITAIDSDAQALELAASNAASLQIGGVEFLHEDIRRDILPGRTFDLILANPPYIALNEFLTLQPEVRDHEPRGALTDEGDGTSFLRRILEFSASRLTPAGTLLMEIGAGQSEACTVMAAGQGLVDVTVHPDHAGIPRVLEARRGKEAGPGR